MLHNSLFLVAHFHNVVIGGVLFGAFAAYTYWFPKAFGFTLDERLGKWAFWCWFIGFYMAFMPLYALGFMGATRRMQHYDEPSWQPLFLIAAAGALVILLGIFFIFLQLVVSIRTRDRRRDLTGDPWNGRSLEWSTTSPPPPYNYAILPQVESMDAFWEMKKRGEIHRVEPELFEAIHMPKNSANGFIMAFFAVALGFGMIWHIWWMAIAGFFGLFATFLALAWSSDEGDQIEAHEVAEIEVRA
jgi:cytochrome o ubiquinol oxidase subunit 1